MENYDVCILGAGPAGLTSAIYSGRYGLRTIIISKDIGGTANLAHKIENYPGFIGSGRELMNRFYEQAKEHNAEFLNDDVINIEKKGKGFVIVTSKRKLDVKSIIIAFGLQKRKLNIPGEAKFSGKGVSYCAVCDASFFKRKDVAIIGGGDAACKAAILLSGIANKVYFIYRGEKEACEAILGKQMRERNNIELIFNAEPVEILGKQVVSELVLKRRGKEERVNLQGVFIEIGGLPVSDIAKILGVKIDKNEYILVDEEMKTNVPGVFAAGDVVKSKLKQVVVAASQGALAAKAAYEYLSK